MHGRRERSPVKPYKDLSKNKRTKRGTCGAVEERMRSTSFMGPHLHFRLVPPPRSPHTVRGVACIYTSVPMPELSFVHSPVSRLNELPTKPRNVVVGNNYYFFGDKKKKKANHISHKQ